MPDHDDGSDTAEGYSNENIAALLSIGLPTVRTHMKSAYRKTSTGSRVELVRMLIARA